MKLLMIAMGLMFSLQTMASTATHRSLNKGLYDGGGTNLTVGTKTAQIEMGCSHGDFARPTLNGNGTFFADGFIQSEMMSMPPPAKRSVHYEGSISKDGKELKLTIVEKGVRSSEMIFKKTTSLPHLMKCR